MDIPLFEAEPAIDWNEFIDLLEEERGFKHRDFYRRFYHKDHHEEPSTNRDVEKPYVDFWHFIISTNSIFNGCYFYLHQYTRDFFEDYVIKNEPSIVANGERCVQRYVDALMEIQNHIFDAAKDHINDDGELHFYAWW